MFITVCNLIGLIPGFEAPTAIPSVPLGCALVTWFYYHLHGIRHNGFGYIKHFLGPVWWLAPLMFIIEIASHLARILSLTVRLFANMFAGDMVTLVFFSLIPIGIPVHLHAAARRRLVHPDVHLRAAGDGVYRRGGGARALGTSFEFWSQVSSRSLVRYWPFALHLAWREQRANGQVANREERIEFQADG